MYYDEDTWKQAGTPATVQMVFELITLPFGGGYSSCPGLIGSSCVVCKCCGRQSTSLM